MDMEAGRQAGPLCLGWNDNGVRIVVLRNVHHITDQLFFMFLDGAFWECYQMTLLFKQECKYKSNNNLKQT